MNKVFLDLEFHPIDYKYWNDRYIQEYEILQIGAILLDGNNNEIGSFNSYCYPEYISKFQSRILNLCHIKEEDLMDAPYFDEVLLSFLDWIYSFGHEFEIYSWSNSDLDQINHELDLKQIDIDVRVDYMLSHWIDFQEQFDHLLGFHNQLSLKTAIELTGIDYDANLHDALSDSRNTSLLYIYTHGQNSQQFINKIKKILQPEPVAGPSLGDLIDLSSFLKK